MPVKILLIDDEPDYSETMEFWLMAHGYSVRSASSGMDGVEAIRRERPDIVFLDMQMPGMDGVETLKEIRKEFHDLPVIMVTAYATEEKKGEAMSVGVDDFFPKGADFSEAARLIAECLIKKSEVKSQRLGVRK